MPRFMRSNVLEFIWSYMIMKNWIKSHYRVLIAISLFIITYIILFNICQNYIEFDTTYRNLYKPEIEFNMKVARFYFIQLPLGSVIPSLFYIIISYLNNKMNK